MENFPAPLIAWGTRQDEVLQVMASPTGMFHQMVESAQVIQPPLLELGNARHQLGVELGKLVRQPFVIDRRQRHVLAEKVFGKDHLLAAPVAALPLPSPEFPTKSACLSPRWPGSWHYFVMSLLLFLLSSVLRVKVGPLPDFVEVSPGEALACEGCSFVPELGLLSFSSSDFVEAVSSITLAPL